MRRPLHILTWHIHGSYLLYLTQVPHHFYLPVDAHRHPGYEGRCGSNPWGPNVHEVTVDQLPSLKLDCVIYQWRDHYFHDQDELLTAAQRRLPKIYIEHDPPMAHPTQSRHPVQDRATVLVHVTPFNALMWDSGITPTRTIEHGVMIPDGVAYQGDVAKGLVVVNHLERRGRRLGSDLFHDLKAQVPLDLVGMAAEESGGLGEVPLRNLPAFESRYRFFFNPIRYTSLGLAVCEAMMVGMPIVGLATTEMVTVIKNGISGYLDTRPERLVPVMRYLLQDLEEARRWGEAAKRYAQERFAIQRFVRDWLDVLAEVTGVRAPLTFREAVC